MIRIDPEFQSLIPPLTEDEFRQLEENILKDGIRDPLVVWPQSDGNSILVDGHNRWNIAAKHGGINFKVVPMEFDDREAAKAWIIRNQFGRRNISAYDRSVLALKLKPIIQAEAKKRMSEGAKGTQISAEAKGESREELAKIAGVSHDTIQKVETIEKSNDERLKDQVRSGEMSINKAYLIAKGVPENKSPAQMKREFLDKTRQEHENFQAKRAEGVVSMEDIQKEKQNLKALAAEVTLRIMKSCKSVSNVLLDSHIGTLPIADVVKAMTKEDKERAISFLSTAITSAEKLLEVIKG